VGRTYFQEKAEDTLVGYSKEAVTEIANEAYNEYMDSVRRINSQKHTQTTRDRTEKMQEDGALVLASRNAAAENPLAALNEWKRLEGQVELSVYLEQLGYLEEKDKCY
jgi:NACalpha-BTF3-like transcription factor